MRRLAKVRWRSPSTCGTVSRRLRWVFVVWITWVATTQHPQQLEACVLTYQASSLQPYSSPQTSQQKEQALPKDPSRIPPEVRPGELSWHPPASADHFKVGNQDVFHAEDGRLPLVSLIAVAPIRPAPRHGASEGLSFLTAALLRRGGTAQESPSSFDDHLARLAAEVDTSASDRRFVAALDVPSWHFEEAAELFIEMLTEPAFDLRWAQALKENVASQLEAGTSSPQDEAELRIKEALYGSSHFAAKRLTANGFRSIPRQDLIDFHREHLALSRFTFAAAGDVDRQTLERVLQRRGTSSSSSEPGLLKQPQRSLDARCNNVAKPPQRALYWSPLSETRTGGRQAAPAPNEGAAIVLAAQTEALPDFNSPFGVAFEVLREVFGGQGAISRLQGRLRTDLAVAYSTRFTAEAGPCGKGEVRVAFQTAPSNITAAAQAVFDEMAALRRTPVSPEELATVKTTLLAYKRLQWDTAEEVAGWAADDHLLGRPGDYWQQYSDRLHAVTPEQIQQLAKTYLNESQFTGVVVASRPSKGQPEGKNPAIQGLEIRYGAPTQ